MNEKERIIELVRQKVISMDEALRLLEAGATEDTDQASFEPKVEKEEKRPPKSERNKEDLHKVLRSVVDQAVNMGSTVAKEVADVSNQVVKEVNDSLESRKRAQSPTKTASFQGMDEDFDAIYQAKADDYETKGQAIGQEIERVNEDLHKANEEKIILQQRQREIEILSEIEELTPEMTDQLQEWVIQEQETDQLIARLEKEIERLYEQQEELYNECKENQKADPEFKRFINQSSQLITEQAQQFKEEASREGKRLGRQVADFVKATVDQFTTKDINLSMNVPWLKSYRIAHTFNFEVASIVGIDIDILNGDLQIFQHEGDQIEIRADIKRMGGQDPFTLEQFEEMSTIEVVDNQLIFHVTAVQLSCDAEIYLPKKTFDSLRMNSINGDIDVTSVNAKEFQIIMKRGDITLAESHVEELTLHSKFGDVTLDKVSAELADIDLVNGDILIEASSIATITQKNINGDFRMKGPIGNVKANLVNGDIYLTKEDLTPANIALTNVNGDLKISLPPEQGLNARGKLGEGSIHHRLSRLDTDEVDKDNKFFVLTRQGQDNQQEVQLDLTLTMGDIYLKDGYDLTREGKKQ